MSKHHGNFDFKVDGRTQRANQTWYRGDHCNFNPDVESMRGGSPAIEKHIIDGWCPDTPFISPDANITAFGSCFAVHISRYFQRRKYSVVTSGNINSYVVSCGEGMVNTFVIRQQFEWALENKTIPGGLWHDADAQAHAPTRQVRENTRHLFDISDVFIITLGLSEVWYDAVTEGVMWRAVPYDKFDPARHKFRVTTVAENVDNIREIYRLIRKHRPDAKIVFTLSPIPLVATFRPQSCITANSVSKAVLRAAVDEVYREFKDEGAIHYWPSYEIVTEGFSKPFKSDRRHVKGPVIQYIMMLFEKHYCTKPLPNIDELLIEKYKEAIGG